MEFDTILAAFLAKVTEYGFAQLCTEDRNKMLDGYMRRTIAQFKHVCVYDLPAAANFKERKFELEIPAAEADEIANIVSEGMIVEWMKPYVYKADLLENVLNTADFTSYSPAELLLRITNTFGMAKAEFERMMREYSYNHGDLSDLSL